MNSVAGDALENHKRSLLNEVTAELQHQRQSHEHLQECQESVRRHWSEVQQVVQVQQVASREVDKLETRMCLRLSQKDSIIKNLYTKSRSGASENSLIPVG